MADINLLPEELRAREQEARQKAASASAPRFSNPTARAQVPEEGVPAGRWQQLVSALKQNLSVASVTPSAPAASAAPPPVPKSVSPASAAPTISTMPVYKPAAPQPVAPRPPAPPLAVPPRAVVPRPPVGGTPPIMLDVNLIPEQEGGGMPPRTVRVIALAGVAALLLVAVAYFVVRSYVVNKVAENEKVQQEVIVLQGKLEAVRAAAEEAMATQRRVQALGEQLDRRADWAPFFVFLEKHTIPAVQLLSLAADANGRVTVTGQALNYTEVGRQMLAFEEGEEAHDVILANLALGKGLTQAGENTTVVQFTIALTFPSELFIARSQ
ncbi:MAG: hypothetical protein Q8P77_02730 [Candidatus Veblenbacteria bacterium]|nr:hypothetical protein [Candidatus Veblenbacteria bacterium]